MPRTVGVRELKNQASRVIRRVSEEMVEYVVTVRGEPVALLRPLTKEEVQRLLHAEVEESLPFRRRGDARHFIPSGKIGRKVQNCRGGGIC